MSSLFEFGGKTAPGGEVVEGETGTLCQWSDDGT